MRVLLVEDEAIIAKDMESILNIFGCDVAGTAVTGEDSIRQAEAFRPDLVFMDIRLKGGMDGIEAGHRIHDGLNIPVVYVTALGEDVAPAGGKKKDGFPRVMKPFEDCEIERIIKKFLPENNN